MPQQAERQRAPAPAPAPAPQQHPSPPKHAAPPQRNQAAGLARSQAAVPKASHREVKARLMETLREIKRLEGGGMFDRHYVEKLRRRAARLAAEYEAGRATGEARRQPAARADAAVARGHG